jgi:hypothetical protein
MVNGDITVHGKLTRDDAPESPRREPEGRGRMCPAMAQQRTDIGNEAAPQEFIRLIGCRDPRRARSAASRLPTLAPRA